MKINDTLNNMHIEMYNLAIDELKRLVKIKFSQNKKLDYFLIAMGNYFFVDINGDILDETQIGIKAIDDFICEWNSILKMSGHGEKWYKDGTVITDW